MYRKHLRMARGQGESQQTGLKSDFVGRVVKLPFVHVAWDYAANTYTHIKESNKLVNFTLTNAEKSVSFVAEQAKPMVLKFEKQIQAVDDLACKGLGTLEEKVPFITKPPDEILGETKKLYESTVSSRLEDIRNYGNNKVKSVVDYGFQKAVDIFGTPLVQTVLTSADGALVIIEHCIDLILPPTEDEAKNGAKKDDEKETISVLSRLGHLSNTVRIRTYQHLTARFRSVQEISQDFIPYPEVLLSLNQKFVVLIRLVTTRFVLTYEEATALIPDQNSGTTENNPQELAQSPAVVTAVKDRVLWVFGMLRLIPSLLPVYLYALASWLDSKSPSVDEVDQFKVEGGDQNAGNYVDQTSNDGRKNAEESH